MIFSCWRILEEKVSNSESEENSNDVLADLWNRKYADGIFLLADVRLDVTAVASASSSSSSCSCTKSGEEEKAEPK